MKRLGIIAIVIYIMALCCFALMTACRSSKQLREGKITCHIDSTTIHRRESVFFASICRQISMDSLQFFIEYKATDSILRDSAGRVLSKIRQGFISGSSRHDNVTTRELQGATKKAATVGIKTKQELTESRKKTILQKLVDSSIFTLYILIIIVLLRLLTIQHLKH